MTINRDHDGSSPSRPGGGSVAFVSDTRPRHAGIVRRYGFRSWIPRSSTRTTPHPRRSSPCSPHPEFLRAKFEATEAIDFEVVECAEASDGGFRIVTNRTVRADIPGFAKKFFKPENAMTQTEDWGPAVGRSRARAPGASSRTACRSRCRLPAPTRLVAGRRGSGATHRRHGSKSACRSSAASSSGSSTTRRRRRWTSSTRSASSGWERIPRAVVAGAWLRPPR